MQSTRNFEVRIFRRKIFDIGFNHPKNPYDSYCVSVPLEKQKYKTVCDSKIKVFNDHLKKYPGVVHKFKPCD